MNINYDRKQIRTFGLALAALLTAIGAWKLYKGQGASSSVLLIAGFISAASAIFFQPLIKPVYAVMMKLSHTLGWINTRILLGLIFYLMITPTGLVIKLFGKDLLDRSIEPDKSDYWIKREKTKFDKSRYENQF